MGPGTVTAPERSARPPSCPRAPPRPGGGAWGRSYGIGTVSTGAWVVVGGGCVVGGAVVLGGPRGRVVVGVGGRVVVVGGRRGRVVVVVAATVVAGPVVAVVDEVGLEVGGEVV